MSTLLLVVIYVSFIGLGLPDALFGTAWPAIYSEFGLPISYGSFVTVIMCCGTVVSSILSARIISKLGTNKVTLISTALTTVCLFAYSFSDSFLPMCIVALPLGLGAGAIDAGLNNYVSLHYSATHMSFLHCFFGIGVSVSPFIMSMVIASESGWRGGYRYAFVIQLCITLLVLFTMGVWRKAHSAAAEEEKPLKVLTIKQMVRIPGVKAMWIMFLTCCAIECTCGGWGSTFLVEHKGMAADAAARTVMFYYIGMALGRFLSGILATRFSSWQLIRFSQIALGVALLILLLPLGSVLSACALFMIGIGIGPLFPNYNYLTPQNFGEDVSQSVMGTQMAASYVGIMLAPALCGVLGQRIGMQVYPPYMLVLYVIMIIATVYIKRILKVNE